MASRFEFFPGIAYWTKYKEPDPKYNTYSIQLYVDKETQQRIKASGLAIRPKLDDDNKVFFTFRRPHEKTMKNELVTFGPPKVYYGTDDDGKAKEFNDLVGNGSKVLIKVSIYDTSMGKGHRLEAIRVDELVEYKPNNTTGDYDIGLPF